MHLSKSRLTPISLILVVSVCSGGSADPAALGIFEAHADVGNVLHPGSVEFDPNRKTYTIAGSGENIWAAQDAFQFVWKKTSGDLTLTADIAFIGTSPQGHRKACLMIRQSLDSDSPYVDVALHGDGLTSLQFRKSKGAVTEEVRAKTSGPKRLRLEKHGNEVRMYLAGEGEDLKPAGSIQITFEGPFYVGLAVCSHDANRVETAVFSNVELKMQQ